MIQQLASKISLLEAALHYAALGYAVFPCAPGGKTPITKHGHKSAATDPDQIESWWKECLDANIGLPTNGMLVIDVDGADNKWPGNLEMSQELTSAPTSETPRGGRHYLFRQPDGSSYKNTTGRIAPSVDTRADGGYIVVPPSVIDGKTYRWLPTMALELPLEQLSELPAWLLTALAGSKVPQRSDGNQIPSGQRNDTLARLAGAMRRVGMAHKAILAALVQENEDRCSPPLSKNEVEKIATSICRYEPDQISVAVAEDHWGQDQSGKNHDAKVSGLCDPDPIPVRRLSWQPFPVDVFPEPIRAFVSEGAAALGCDPSMIALPVLSVCAGAIGLSRCVRVRNSWHEWPIIWAAVVAESGTLKTPAFDLAMKPLRDIQDDCFRVYGIEQSKNDSDLLSHEADLAAWKRSKDRGEPPVQPDQVTCTRFIVEDATIEALVSILKENPRGVLMATDELSGWFGSFNQYKNQGGDVSNWLKAHCAGPITVDRKTGKRLTHVPHGGISIAGSIQPLILERALTQEFFACGLAARLLLAAPPKKRKSWGETDISTETCERYASAVRTLSKLASDFVDDIPHPRELKLSPDARVVWLAFYDEFAGEQFEAEGDLAACFSKLEAYVIRFALVFQLIENPSAEMIERSSMAAGIKLARWFANEAERVYGLWSSSDEDRESTKLIELVARKGGRITCRELQQSSRCFRQNAALAKAALDQLVSTGEGRWVEQQPTAKGGRPTRHLELVCTDGGNITPSNAIGNEGFGSVTSVDGLSITV